MWWWHHYTTCYNQLQKYLRHCTVFWHKWPVHDLVLVIPPPPLIKVASNTRPYSKLGGTTLNGREEGSQYYISQTRDQERFEARKVVFSWECQNIFATGWSYSLAISPGKEAVNVYFQLRDRCSFFIPNCAWKQHILRSLSLQPYLQYTQDSWLVVACFSHFLNSLN